MKNEIEIGQFDESIDYIDRPTVKVIIRDGDKVLILNQGLLPGGGIDEGESVREAVDRELREELGVTVDNVEEIGTVIQYRNFISKRYVIKGFVSTLATSGLPTEPQDDGEAEFVLHWLAMDKALELVRNSIEMAEENPMDSDANQSRLYNMMTTYDLLKKLGV